MNPERWKQIDELVQGALDRSAEERTAFIEEACSGDDLLRREVESVLAYRQGAPDFLESPAVEQAAELITDSQTHSLEGKTFSHYTLTRKIGAGGMGEVYLAEDTRLRRKVAIKFLPPESVADPQAKKRLIREAQAAAALDHPNVCAIHEVGEEGGRSFIVMQYIEGETLAERLKRKPLDIGESLGIAVEIADGIAEAHSGGIIHRDIKPQNIVINARGQVKVLDFGLAKIGRDRSMIESQAETESLLTAPDVRMGTVPYMSPEQVRGDALDARSDIFSLAVVIYEMLSGQRPFAAENAAETCSEILSRKQAPLARFCRDLPAELERIVDKALNKDREERYQTTRDLLIDLRSLRKKLALEADATSRGGPGAASTPTAAPVATSEDSAATAATVTTTQETEGERARGGRHRWLAIAAVAILAVGVAAYFALFNRAAALTDKDTILIADFVNTTGDAVFDDTLKQALAVQLGQSPFLNIFPEQRVRETLRYMARSPDERVTKEIAREICQREGIKALLTGSIASLGSHYVITLETLNSQTGDALAREQVEAESKERVISKLGEAATKLREKLGESLASIRRFDTPLAQATTSSLEALKAYTSHREHDHKGNLAEAILFAKRAVELDPDFAMAYAALALAYYNNNGPPVVSEQYAAKAFELRERVTERERFFITSMYHDFVTKDFDKRFEITDLWRETYPRDPTVRFNQANLYARVGQYEKAVEQASEAMRLNPNRHHAYFYLGWVYRALGRYDEAKATIEQARARNLDSLVIHMNAYLIAFAEGDQAEMRRQLEWASGKPSEFEFLDLQSWTEMFAGRYRQSQETARRALESAQSQDLKAIAADIISTSAIWDALVGNCQRAGAETAKALATAPGAEPPSPRIVGPCGGTSLASALCGDVARAQSIIDDLARRNPTSTVINGIWGPVIRAAIEIGRGNQAEAIRLLQKAKRYEMGQEAGFWPTYMRGQAYLGQGSAAEAIAEFQKVIDRRGVSPADPLYPLSYLGLARAAASAGDTDRSRNAYQDFFALWRDADSDIPILVEARKEYEKLQ